MKAGTFYTFQYLELTEHLILESGASHQDLQRVFAGANMPDNVFFGMVLLQYRTHKVMRQTWFASRLKVPALSILECPSCFGSSCKLMQGDACFKWRCQV